MNDILTVSGLNKSYGDFSLKDVTFSLPEGCITGFIGVNGAGKTTTLRTLLGLTNKLSGKIQFFGLDMDKNRKLILDLQELQIKYPKYGLIFPTLWLSVRRLRILCLEISEVKNDVVRPTKKGFSDCKKICADYACSYCTYPTCHALADTGVYGSFWIYSFCHFWRFHAVAICIPKRVSISKSCDITMCHTIFTESNSFIKIHFLHGYICNLLYRF